MLMFGSICLTIAAIFVIVLLYRKISGLTKYIKTVGEIIDVRNMIPLVDKRQVDVGGNYKYTECKYCGNVHVTIKFINRDGEELIRRYNSSEPMLLKINEHEHSAPQYTCVSPDWQIGRRIILFYDPQNTLNIFVGKVLRHMS